MDLSLGIEIGNLFSLLYSNQKLRCLSDEGFPLPEPSNFSIPL